MMRTHTKPYVLRPDGRPVRFRRPRGRFHIAGTAAPGRPACGRRIAGAVLLWTGPSSAQPACEACEAIFQAEQRLASMLSFADPALQARVDALRAEGIDHDWATARVSDEDTFRRQVQAFGFLR